VLDTLTGKDSVWLATPEGVEVAPIPAIGKTAKEAFESAAVHLGPESAFSNTKMALERSTKEGELAMDSVLDVLRKVLQDRFNLNVNLRDTQARNSELLTERRAKDDRIKALENENRALTRALGERERLRHEPASNGEGASSGEVEVNGT
jgi:hypothetical protein